VAASYDGAALRIYVDGVLDASRTVVAAIQTGGSSPVLLGGRPGQPWNGSLDEVRIWSVARTVAEISLFKDKSLAGTTAGLLAYFDFNEGAGSSTVVNRGSVGGSGTLTNMAAATAFVAPGMVPALGLGAQTVTLTVSDKAGNVSSTTATITVSVPVLATTAWTGNASTDWSDCRNWEYGKLPTTAISAMIPAGMPRYPVISSSAAVAKDLTIASGASLTLSSVPTLEVYGDWTNNGTATLTGSGSVIFRGSVNQTIGGSSATPFSGLAITKTGGTVQLTRDLAIGTALWLNSGTLTTTAAYKVVLSPTATLLNESETAYIIGTVETTRLLNVAGAGSSFGGLGLVLTPNAGSSTLPGSTTVRRVTGTPLTGVNSRQGIARYFDVVPATNAALDVAMTFAYFDHELNGIAAANLAMFKSESGAAGPWAQQRPAMPGANTFSRAGIADFSIWTLGDANNPLPVELTEFTAQAQQAAVALKWRTASEKNNDHFEVERSRDGHDFGRIATVAGQGTKASPTDYALLDEQLPGDARTLYYRLRQVDTDGKASYSPVRVVSFDRALLPAFAVYPNPTHDGAVTVVQAAAGAHIVVLDALGRTVAQATADAGGTARLVLPSELATGVYVVRSGTQTQRLVVE
jgi:hypothetical protein